MTLVVATAQAAHMTMSEVTINDAQAHPQSVVWSYRRQHWDLENT